jgi:peptide/nickel transport system substrate-binding protein
MDWITALVFDGLVAAGPDGQVEPRLAHAWEADSDGASWTFHLVEGVAFHDGSTFDAEDVKYSFERIPSSDSPLAGVLDTLERVEVVNPTTVAFHLSDGAIDFPLLMTDRRMRVVSATSDGVIGTGPFAVTTFDPANTTTLTAFDDYWQGTPRLAGVDIVAMPDAETRLVALESGRLDLVDGLVFLDVETLVGHPEFTIQQVPSGDWRGIVFDTRAEPYNDVRVRQALKLVVDRTEMIELVAGGAQGAEISCDTPVWSSDPYFVPGTCEQDIRRAKDLLTEAGYPGGLDITITSSRLYSDWLSLAEVFQYQAAQAGIRVKIVQADADGYWSEVWMNDPAVTTSWAERTAEQVLAEAFVSTAPWNESFWKNAEFDALVAAASAESDPDRRAELYRNAQEILRAESGTIIPYHVKKSRVVASDVRGVPDGIGRYTIAWHEVSVVDP